ncbi:hypothetical protein DAPPUDRAFT_233017 [Daphnia pulex]|uniref:Uncharacterized protein n=1 Tax=Daphnia pulex TaxID=6669 RepID=E9FSY6_DAPPU|nr:hypothetical protein DAPPUDRAFT_233017 [Daphnia pulex]|eukprot:EFX89733.1 hypothetical protein DAPPUDRAFT_233017 [Daphnia pulex]
MDGILIVIKGPHYVGEDPSTDPNIEPGRNLELNWGRAGSDLTLGAIQANQTGPDGPIETAALFIIRQTEPVRKRGRNKTKKETRLLFQLWDGWRPHHFSCKGADRSSSLSADDPQEP